MRTKKEQKNVNRRILYLWLPNIALDRLRRTTRKLDAKKLPSIAAVIVRTEYGRRTIVSTCAISKGLGIIVGWSLDDALALYSNLLVAEIDPITDKTELATLANWCGKYTPMLKLQSLN